jgi:glutamine amidotransferase-like uncharacterized protein
MGLKDYPGGCAYSAAKVRFLENSSGLEAIPSRPLSVIPGAAHQPHLDSPQFRQVIQPSIITTAAVLHLLHS